VVINLEILMTNDHAKAMWRKPKIMSRLISIVFDEAHCISQWRSFRNEYLHVGSLRQFIPDHIPFYLPSATLPPLVCQDIDEILSLCPENTEYILCSNDQPEICLIVQKMAFPANSFHDLAFLVPKEFKEGDTPSD
jgi:superfamily II DNA helicase RecQ